MARRRRLDRVHSINEGWPKLKALPKVRPLGTRTPRVWSVEPAFGCNLFCAHCCNDLIPKERYEKMRPSVWAETFRIINEVSPTVRVDLCGFVGEPTLHERLPELLPLARRLAPRCQIQITTNGTAIRQGRMKIAQLLRAGANIVYLDQYGPRELYERLARESGYPFYRYYGPEAAGLPTPWRWYGPHVKMTVLMEPPHSWPKSRFRAGLLGNWYGNVNFERARAFGMRPLEAPLRRRCNQPFLYVTVAASGDYLLCCQDGLQTTAGRFGSVLEGVDGFRRFWFGRELQTVRERLRRKDRASTPYACAKCNITFSRCDFKHWTDDEVSSYWDGAAWQPLEADPGEVEEPGVGYAKE